MRSAKVFIEVFTGKGGGLSSITHKRFLANPCFSRFHCVPNCTYMVHLIFKIKFKQSIFLARISENKMSFAILGESK